MDFISTLTLILIILKLLDVIQWSWLWILSPIWIIGSVLIVLFAFILIGGRIKKGKW